MKLRYERFIITPVEILEFVEGKIITPTECMVLQIIESYVNRKNGCYVGNSYLAKSVGVKIRQIMNILARLKKLKLIKSYQKKNKRYLETCWSRVKIPIARGAIDCTVGVQSIAPILIDSLRSSKRRIPRFQENANPPLPSRNGKMLFEKYNTPPKDKITTKNKENATKLKKWVVSQNFVASRNRRNWAEQFRLLAKEVSQERIDAALDWYCENATKKTKPRLLNGKQFREHFNWLEDIMRQGIREVSPMASAIATKLNDLVWPKGSEKDLPTTIQLCIDNYKPFHEWIQAVATSDRKTPVFRLIRYLNDVLPGRRKMAESWMRKVWDRINNWDDWNGNLHSEALTVDGKRFQAYLRELANEYSGSFGKLINQLMEMYDTHAN